MKIFRFQKRNVSGAWCRAECISVLIILRETVFYIVSGSLTQWTGGG
jgi:hypothetical protein